MKPSSWLWSVLLAGGLSAIGTAQEITNAVDGSILVWIPGGEFDLGSADGNADEKPVTRVKVRGFWLGKFEVTNEQYARFLKTKSDKSPLFWEQEGFRDPRQPVVAVRWLEAQAYCEWAGLRLPSEVEWECAAKGGRQLRFPTSTGELRPDLALYWDRQRKKPAASPNPVGSFPPNPFGLFDMAGNAWEWTSSTYASYPPKADDDDSGVKSFRVMRGGCWAWSGEYCRSTYRHRFREHLTYDFVGIRVALSERRAASRPEPSPD